MNYLIITGAKLISWLIKAFHLGHGSTWPGHIILSLNKNFIKQTLSNNKLTVILIAGTNGKTTTSRMIRDILEQSNKKVIQNESGANLLNGIASTLALSTTPSGRIPAEYAIFEVDENALPQILKVVTPDYLVLLNLFRDQLDRYGEVRTIAANWSNAIKDLQGKTVSVVNADDPELSYLFNNRSAEIHFFGLNKNSSDKVPLEHAADSIHCPKCGKKLHYRSVTFSHLGDWKCTHCNLKRPSPTLNEYGYYPLYGTYNKYNTLAAVLTANILGVNASIVEKAIREFKPAFGRQEIIKTSGKYAQIFLAKNPTGFNESLRTIRDLHAETLLFVLNDRIPDGTDISWIWDVDVEIIGNGIKKIIISGDRAYDMGLRIKYADYKNYVVVSDMKAAVERGLNETEDGKTLFILPTYSAMLEVREYLTGKGIL